MEVVNHAAIRIIERYRREKEEKLAKRREEKREYARKRYLANPKETLERVYKWKAENRASVLKSYRKHNLKRYYGITIKEWDALFIKQGSCCACCQTTKPGKKGWAIDHCHITGIIRGILCHNCNLAIGHAKDNIEILKSMIAYLEKHSTGAQHANGHSYPRPSFNTASP